MTKNRKILILIGAILAIALSFAIYYWVVSNWEISIPKIKIPEFNWFISSSVALIILAVIIVAIGKREFLIPALIAAFIIVFAIVIGASFDGISFTKKASSQKDQPEKNESTKTQVLGTPPEWEKVADCPIHFARRVFEERVGPNGERPYTGEIYPNCFVEDGYRYKISFSGDYSRYFINPPWHHKISWKGWTPQNSNVKLPYPKHQNMALVLRIGNMSGLHPDDKKDFIIFVPTEDAKIFAELNVNREAAEYYHPTEGLKFKNSTLSIRLERQPL